MTVIAVARQLGARGEELAHHIAGALRLRYVDREIVANAAAAAGVSPELLDDFDERWPGFLERVMGVLYRHPLGDPMGYFPVQALEKLELPTPATARRLIEGVVTELARQGDVVLIGHGAPFFLRRRPGVLSVYFCGSRPFRQERLETELGCDAATALRRLKESDHQRTEYVRANWGLGWSDPSVYDLVINTDWFNADTALALVRDALGGLLR